MSLAALESLVQSWGGRIQYVSTSDPLWHDLSLSPFSAFLAIDHEQKIVYCVEGFDEGETVHEVAHVFASTRSPDFSEEYDFFGWEFEVAVQVGLVDEWLQSAGNYSVGGTQFIEFEDMTIDEQSDLLEERVQYAQKIGLIRDGQPVSVR